jgi:hypothetical protein
MSGAINGPHVGVIISAGLLYTALETAEGPLNIPNSSLLAAAVGPAVTPPEPVTEETTHQTPRDAGFTPAQDGSATVATVVAGAESGVAAGDGTGRDGRKHTDN